MARSAKLSTSSSAGEAPIDDRREGRGGDAGQRGQRAHVVGAEFGARAVAHFVIDHQQAIRLAARRAELFLVDLAEQQALVEFDGALQVAADLRPADVQDLDLQPVGELDAVDQPGDAAPGAFQLAQAGVVQDGIDLLGQHGIDRGDVAIDRIAQRLVIDAQPRAAFRAEPEIDRIAGRRAEELAERVRQRGIAAAGEAARQHRVAHRGRSDERRVDGCRRSGGQVHGEVQRRSPRRPPDAEGGDQPAAAGMRATMRRLVVSSSICSHGRR